MKIGSHVGMSGKEMLLGSAREAVSYGADTFMFYTGAPQNTRRKEISELNIAPAWEYMKAHGIDEIIVHAPYIINLGNSVKAETFSLAVEFLAKEIDRTISCGSHILILHPGAHVGAGTDAGTAQIIKGLNEVLSSDTDCCIALETMAGKGSEIGRSFEELARIYDGVVHSERLRVCFDTCHTSDSGYDIISHFDSVMDEFDARTATKTSGSDRSGSTRWTTLSTIRILQTCRRSWRPPISLRKSIRKSLMRRTNTRSRCSGTESLIPA